MSYTFYTVYKFLIWLSETSGLSYEAVNVIVYYVFIQLIFCLLADKVMKKLIFTPLLIFSILSVIAIVRDLDEMADKIFNLSVNFLLSFSFFGVGYDPASVIVCVIAPIFIFLLLFYFAFPDFSKRLCPTFTKVVEGITNKARAKILRQQS